MSVHGLIRLNLLLSVMTVPTLYLTQQTFFFLSHSLCKSFFLYSSLSLSLSFSISFYHFFVLSLTLSLTLSY